MIEQRPNEQNFPCLDFNIRSLTLCATERLMDHDTGVGQALSFALCTRRQEECAHGGSGSKADSGHVTRDELHRVKDGEACGHGPSGGVDVQGNVLGGIVS